MVRGWTLIIIVHRFAPVRDADQVITVKRRRAVKNRTHEELVRRGGRHGRLRQNRI
jgi:ABC-type multidrug transport system fused ATPase/permease subunit